MFFLQIFDPQHTQQHQQDLVFAVKDTCVSAVKDTCVSEMTLNHRKGDFDVRRDLRDGHNFTTYVSEPLDTPKSPVKRGSLQLFLNIIFV